MEDLGVLEFRMKVIYPKPKYESTISNCYIHNDGKLLFDVLPNGSVIVNLDGFAIIPLNKLKYPVKDIIKR